MSQRDEAGGNRSILFGSYTYWAFLGLLPLFGWLIHNDLQHRRVMCTAIGLSGDGWVWGLLLIGNVIARNFAWNGAQAAYERISKRTLAKSPNAFVEAGGSDVIVWTGLLGLVAAAIAFGFLVPPGWLGLARPVVFLIAVAITAKTLSAIVARALFRAGFAPPRPVYDHRPVCQEAYPGGGYCVLPAHKDEKFCRWHLIAQRLRVGLENARPASPMLMIGAATGLMMIAQIINGIDAETATLRLSLAGFVLGGITWFFSRAMILRDLPMAWAPAWPKLLAAGLTLEVIAGFTALSHFAANPAAATPILRAMRVTPAYDQIAQIVILLGIASCSAIALSMLLRDVLCYDPPLLGSAVWGLMLSLLFSAVLPLLRDVLPALARLPAAAPAGPAREVAMRAFWEPVVGNRTWIVMAVTILGFGVSEVINAGTRRRQLTDTGFKNTVWPSFPVCAGSPVLAGIASRYIMTWTGISGLFPFVALAILITIVLCRWGTRWVMRLYAAQESVQPARTRPTAARSASGPRHAAGYSASSGLGSVFVSPGANVALSPSRLQQALAVHATTMMLKNDLLSNYDMPGGRHLFILTEPDHTRTLVLLDADVETYSKAPGRFEPMG